jgi:hypothetical protein
MTYKNSASDFLTAGAERVLADGVASAGEKLMRTTPVFAAVVVGSVIGIGSAIAAVSAKGPIAPIVCTIQDNLDVANLPAVAKSEVVLRALGCRRSGGTGVWKLLRNAKT